MIDDYTPVQHQQCKTTLNNQNQAAPASQRTKKRSFATKHNNKKFAQKLQRTHDHVLLYEHPNLKEKALECMPVKRFNEDALHKYNAYKSNMQVIEKSPYSLNDFVLLELMTWFKS